MKCYVPEVRDIWQSLQLSETNNIFSLQLHNKEAWEIENTGAY